MIDVVTGPLGFAFVLAVLGLLVTREFLRLHRPTALRRRTSVGSVLTYCAGVLAFAVLALRLIDL
ncbi:hypothetical protein BJF78_29395 [Pseudonocardia sp. CNS-139]|nr:hypothetical protein BJF78_29395 [Pseudonocardia sp. CNS-139]